MGNSVDVPAKSSSPASTRPPSPGRLTTKRISSNSTFGWSMGSIDELYPGGVILEVPNLRTFTFAELKTATRNFKPDTILGDGGFGTVHRGWVDEKTLNPCKSMAGMAVAVKRLHPEGYQGLEEWQVIA